VRRKRVRRRRQFHRCRAVRGGRLSDDVRRREHRAPRLVRLH